VSHHGPVGRRKHVAVQFAKTHPGARIVSVKRGNVTGHLAFHEPQADPARAAHVEGFAQFAQRRHVGTELLPPFAAQRRRGRLAAPHLAPGKLPMPGQRVVAGTPGDEKPPAPSHHARHNANRPHAY